MRMRATIERRRERYEFIYKYRQEMADIVEGKLADADIRQFVEQVARPELTYGPRTYYFDIYMTLRRDYHKIFIDGKHQRAN